MKLSMQAALKKVNNLENLGFNRGILSGALVRINQLQEEKKKNEERDADLPKVTPIPRPPPLSLSDGSPLSM